MMTTTIFLSFSLALVPILPVVGNSFLPNSFTANYQQIIQKKISGKLKKTFGTMEYRYPGHIRIEQVRPEKIVWVSNSQKTWFYQAPLIEGEAGQLRMTKTNREPLTIFFDALKHGLESNKFYRVKKNAAKVELVFNKKIMGDQLDGAILVFNGQKLFKNLQSIDVVQRSGLKSHFELKKILTNIKHGAKRFFFKIPPNTRIEQ